MTDRRAELEKKKLKLQQLRELKEQRRNDKYRDRDFMSDLGLGQHQTNRTIMSASSTMMTNIINNNPTNVNNNSLNNNNNNSMSSSLTSIPGDSTTRDVDELLESVGIMTNKGSAVSLSNHNQNQQQQQSTPNDMTISEDASSLSSSVASNQTKTLGSNSSVKLGLASFPPVLIAPKEQVTYEKQTQTTATSTTSNNGSTGSTGNDGRGGPVDYYEWDDEFHVLTYDDIGNEDDGDTGSGIFTNGAPAHQNQHGHHQHPQQQSKQAKSSLPTVEMVRPATTPQDLHHHLHHHHLHHHHSTQPLADLVDMQQEEQQQQKKKKRVEYKEEERRHLMQTEAFRKFLDRAVRITERALSCTDSMDIFVDYTGQVECGHDNEDKSGLRLSLNTTFSDDRWSRGRTVTSFDWCSQFPELLVASYNQNEHAPNEPDGICLVWNMKFKKNTPEYVFHCQSAVMSACFAKFHPNLILGGTYSGQIVLWDNRSGKRVPVQRSPLSASVHTHPVYCLKVVGTPNSHNLISISNDGKLCSWSLDMLSQPQETMELCQQKQSRLIAVTSMSFPHADYNNFILGSQDGAVYSACRHGAKAGILDVFEGHQGPVTAVDFHSATSLVHHQVDQQLSHLFLTASFDWTFKLWSMRDNSTSSKLLYSFEDGSDYLYDVRWSPIHPALFATADGLGKLDLWNLNQDTELPTLSTIVEGNPALNRLIWSPNGQQIVVGDDNGKIWVYDVSEQLAFPKSDEWTRFAHTLQEFTNNNVDI
ncbi:cytoplasmic dynein 1 intermediate chain 2-like isoform X2 [Dermatophagoides pteronyssinus]|uniref:Cytoplasmic dynein 1 intermediate chain 2-like isoform X2 n=1 Tax=Dermatophagoides pteronyssinus TaxID=6956 RepID=A0A6P6XU30_DERPT|nr:cytoplasmic dynein 1 intermediate chain 2-like isoform X2 [Dermatophagoides pteronyssinus]